MSSCLRIRETARRTLELHRRKNRESGAGVPSCCFTEFPQTRRSCPIWRGALPSRVFACTLQTCLGMGGRRGRSRRRGRNSAESRLSAKLLSRAVIDAHRTSRGHSMVGAIGERVASVFPFAGLNRYSPAPMRQDTESRRKTPFSTIRRTCRQISLVIVGSLELESMRGQCRRL